MKAAGSIDDDDILASTDPRIDGVERHRGGVRACLPAYEIGPGAL
jgi:hypothetical protein